MQGIQNNEHRLTYVIAAHNLVQHLSGLEEHGFAYEILDRDSVLLNGLHNFSPVEPDEYDDNNGVLENADMGICIIGCGYRGVGLKPENFYIKPVNSGRANASASPAIEYEIRLANDPPPTVYKERTKIDVGKFLRQKYVVPWQERRDRNAARARRFFSNR
jgi:hypothetical protein